jgi:hypothetical protein
LPLEIGFLGGLGKLPVVIILPSRRSLPENVGEKKPCLVVVGRSSLI